MRIVVASLYKLGRIDGRFDKEQRKLVRENAKVTEAWVNQNNDNYHDTGQWYEVNNGLTAKYNGEISENGTRDELIAEARGMGLEFQKNIKTDKLIELINENK